MKNVMQEKSLTRSDSLHFKNMYIELPEGINEGSSRQDILILEDVLLIFRCLYIMHYGEEENSKLQGWAWIGYLMIQSTSILYPNNWIIFLTQIHFFSKSSLDFVRIQIQIFGLRFKSNRNIWIKFKIQNLFFIKEI